MSIIALKAYIFYLVLKIFDKIDLEQPFTRKISDLISKISYYLFVIGILGVLAKTYSQWIFKKGILFDIDWGSEGFLFIAGVFFIVSYIFKRGIELQEEHNLTI